MGSKYLDSGPHVCIAHSFQLNILHSPIYLCLKTDSKIPSCPPFMSIMKRSPGPTGKLLLRLFFCYIEMHALYLTFFS